MSARGSLATDNCFLPRAGIFEKHKLLFSFQITVKLQQDEEQLTQEELDFFIKVSCRSQCIGGNLPFPPSL